MKYYWITVLVEFAILGSVLSYGEDCRNSADHLQIIADEFTLYNVSTSRPNFICTNMSLPSMNTTYSSVLIQYHVWNSNLTASLYYTPRREYAIRGDHIGLLWRMNSYQQDVQSYVALTEPNMTATEALILYTPLNSSVPVPGSCNMETNPELNPNLNIHYQVENVLINVTFSLANVGFDKNPPDCDSSAPKRSVLRYDFYIMFIPWNMYSKDSLFGELKKMMTVEGIMKHGRKIHMFGKNDKLELRLAMFNGRGVILNTIVRNSITGAMSPYIPRVTYACGNSHGSLCYGRVQPLYGIVFAAAMIIGAVMCFTGHHFFHAELLFFGYLPFCLFSIMILSANTSLSQPVILAMALVFGIPGGLMWVALWWRWGYVLPIMMWVSLTLGFLLSAIVFFTPFGNLNVWYRSLAYGMAYMCGVMIVPVILIVFTKLLSMLACAAWGSYLVIAAISYYSGGVLHYIVLNVIHRSYIPGYSEAYVIVPMNPVDYFLIGVWFVLIVAGVLVQRRLTRGRRDFPLCGFKERLLKRNHEKALRNRTRFEDRERQAQRPMEDPTATLNAAEMNDNDRDPLIVVD
ncbi:transmembrane 7 superfamily member 3 [Strongylocentrotus purpuratus]|uniref:TM7S3/TM198-like domain-containing protein n=1 Tax=Strongylocentrotus purpuratus TaxID=7668 RepID=A0A7M7P4T6_STRPU|nr:transmembrane 7 superfamily member 3 [Strongylocentrotus purpuratus]|eukprot:XP_011675893.1 PREDICTED: transmembrane 7 superfamily member 3 isoform X1 [Strongylocentrotus purpuratus]